MPQKSTKHPAAQCNGTTRDGVRTKIGNLGNVAAPVNAVRFEQHITGLEVTMDDAAAVDVIHTLGHLLGSPQQRPLSPRHSDLEVDC